MRDLLSDYDRLATEGRPVGRAVVTSVWGSAPRPEGSSMLATADGTMAGSVSGGCVEGATATEIGEAIGRGTPKLVTFGVTHERAWEVGLACGGTIKVFVEPRVRPEVLAAARGPGGEAVATVIEGPGTGGSLRIFEDGRVDGRLEGVPAEARPRRRAGRPPPRGEHHRHHRRRRRAGHRLPRGVSAPAAPGHLRRRPHRRRAGTRWRGRWAIARSSPTAAPRSSRRSGSRTPTSASSRGRRRRSSRSGSTRRATCVFSRTTPSSTSRHSSSRSARRRATSARSARARRRRRGATGSGARDSATRTSPGCTDRSGWSWAAASPPRQRWRFWRR